MPVRLYTDAVCLEHDMGEGHPERPARLASILAELKAKPIEGVEWVAPRQATREELLLAHTSEHVDRLSALAGRAVRLDPDTSMSEKSHDAALKAAGSAAQAVEDVMAGKASAGFGLVRPPGHHAEPETAMGFCLFNNAGIAAAKARQLGAQRVALLDWDVHHGNGSQALFWKRRDVLFLSSHQWPYYPGTGAAREIGEGDGAGFTINAALPGGQGDADYGAVFNELFLPVLQQYQPDFLVISAGYDGHRKDPLGGMRLTERGFAAMCTELKKLAGGRLVLLLEGGYDLDALAASTHATIEVLTGARTDTFTEGVRPDTIQALAQSKQALSKHWKLSFR